MTEEKLNGGTRGRWWGNLRLPAALILIVLGVSMVGTFTWTRCTLPTLDGEAMAAGLAAPVEIYRDAYGVPHIFADSATDAYAALGYVHAQDRMWQMEFSRRLGAGRLAEVLGEAGLSADRFTRTMDFAGLVEGDAAALRPETRAALESYAAGVNAWIEGRGCLPPEFAVLGVEPEPWKITDSLLWGRLMAFQLARGRREELFEALLGLDLPRDRIDELWPADPPGAPDTYGNRRLTGLDLPALLDATPPALISRSASNAWVVDGQRSGTGAPVLASDPHLGFSAPGVWYLARIVTPELTVTGATAPGLPFTVLGHNGRVAWGVTSIEADAQDLFVETEEPGNPARYLTPGGPEQFSVRTEMIMVKDAEPVKLTVRSTRHGPVLSDLPGSVPEGVREIGTVVALAAANLEPGDITAEALMAMNRAADANAFRAALAGFVGPTVNVFYADVNGAIGAAARGRLPRRKAGGGKGPFSGSDGVHDWDGILPLDSLPSVQDPPSGRIANGNNRLVADGVSTGVAGFWYASWRAGRILEVIDSAPHGPDAAAKLQNDVLSGAARDLVPLMLNAVAPIAIRHDPRRNAALELLDKWDYRMGRERPEPLIYIAWLRHAVRAIAADELGDNFARYWRPRPDFVYAVLTKNQHWCRPNATRPACAEEMAEALDAALDELEAAFGDRVDAWRWGDPHQAKFPNKVLREVPLIGRFADLSIPFGGGDHTVGRGPSTGGDGEPEEVYAVTHGAVYRAVYDFSDLSKSRFIGVPGQSGNPFSPHYGDMLQPWRDGKYIRMAGGREKIAATAKARLVLSPAGE